MSQSFFTAMDSDDLNPERQNAINRSIDASDRQVIDSFVKRHHETTEALVSSFTYFKMDDVNKTDSKKEKVITTLSEAISEKADAKSSSQRVQNTGDTLQLEDETKTDEDGIEEEILDEGMRSGAMTNCDKEIHSNISQPKRKFGNFVEEADSDSDGDKSHDSETEGDGYCASFSQSDQDVIRQGEATAPDTSHIKKIESLPHATQQAAECELSALVDLQFDDDKYDVEGDGCQLNPGEVEDLPEYIPSLSDLEQVTCLQITTTQNSSQVKTEQSADSQDEVCTDEVEPFKLDENFDYDNVKLTPKFTQQELDYLKSFIPSNGSQT